MRKVHDFAFSLMHACTQLPSTLSGLSSEWQIAAGPMQCASYQAQLRYMGQHIHKAFSWRGIMITPRACVARGKVISRGVLVSINLHFFGTNLLSLKIFTFRGRF